MFYYHDTFPQGWRASPCGRRSSPSRRLEDIEYRIQEGYILCGDPDEVLEQVKRYESVGIDQLVFGLPLNMGWDSAHETIRLFGEHVIPKIDTDPVHRTTRFREQAAMASGVG